MHYEAHVQVGSPLTNREKQVATLAALGYTNQAIADRLFIQKGSVATHLWKIQTKLGLIFDKEKSPRIMLARYYNFPITESGD